MNEKDNECSTDKFVRSAVEGCVSGGTAGFFAPVPGGTLGGCAIGATANAAVQTGKCVQQETDITCSLF